MPSNNIGEGVFVRIPIGREDEFWDIIKSNGYPTTGEGVASFILESDLEDSEGEEPELPAYMMKKWIEEHPEEWNQITKKGSQAIGSLLKWAKKKI